MPVKDFENIQKLYSDLKTNWEKKKSEWEDISHESIEEIEIFESELK